MESLQNRFINLAGEYHVLRAASEAATARRQWATALHYEPTPFWFERNWYPRGRLLLREPEHPIGCVEYGFDAGGQLTLQRDHLDVEGQTYEHFFRHLDGGVSEEASFERRRLHDLQRFVRDGERLVRFERALAGSTAVESYEWQGAQLRRIVEEWPRQAARTLELSYDDAGALRAIDLRQGEAPPRPLYRRPAPEDTLERLLPRVERALVELIPTAVGTRGAAYRLAIVYDAESPESLPPLVALGADGEPAAPAPLPRGEHDELFHLANQQLAMESAHERVHELFRRVAAALTQHNWRAQLGVAPDFVVYAVELSQLETSDYRVHKSE
jgi:hypothetical protein